MCTFKGFKSRNGSVTATFLFDKELRSLTKQETLELHSKNKNLPSPKGTNFETEQTKFTLDRWPDTEL